jgi:hypothetical protein
MSGKPKIFQRVPRAVIAFRPEFLDFNRGIHVGNLEDNERITRLLKLELEYRYQQDFVTERWGRGVYWLWIGFLPRANRAAMPISSSVSFGCSKFFIMVDAEEKLFKCGLQIERGYIKAPKEFRSCELRSDWDWNRLMAALRPGSPMESELKRLVVREGFTLHAGGWGEGTKDFGRKSYPGANGIRRRLAKAPGADWAGFQLFYPMKEQEVLSSAGIDLFESMMAIFDEVTPLMNLCMLIRLPPNASEGLI